MSRYTDETGNTYGRLTVLSYAGSDDRGKATWNCLCECGTRKVIVGASLRKGTTISCGCYKLEKVRIAKGESSFNWS